MSDQPDTGKLRELAEGWTPVPPYVLKLLLGEYDAATAAFKEWQEKYNSARAEVVALSARIEKLRDALRLGADRSGDGWFLDALAADDAAAKGCK